MRSASVWEWLFVAGDVEGSSSRCSQCVFATMWGTQPVFQLFFEVVLVPTSSTVLIKTVEDVGGHCELDAAAQTASQSSHQWAGPKHCCCTAVKGHSQPPSLNQVRSLLKASIPFLNLVSVQFHTFMQMPVCAADSLSQKQSKFKWSSANRVSDQKTCRHQRRCSPWGEDKVKTECVTCWLIGSARRKTFPYLFFLLQRWLQQLLRQSG